MRLLSGIAPISLLCAAVLGICLNPAVGYAQSVPAASQGRLDPSDVGSEPPVMDNMIFGHVLSINSKGVPTVPITSLGGTAKEGSAPT